MRTLLKFGALGAVLLGAGASPAWSQSTSSGGCDKDLQVKPADCQAVQKIRVEIAPPEVYIQPAVANTNCCLTNWLHRCCHFHRQAPTYMAPVASTYQAQPVYSMGMAQPMAMSYAPMASFTPMSMAPMSMAPMNFTPMTSMNFSPVANFAPMNFSPVAPVNFAPAAPLQYTPIAYAPTLPAPTPAPTPPAPVAQPTASSDVNESLKKLSTAVELLTKMVNQQTKILEYHENRLDDLEKKYLDKNPQPDPKKTTRTSGSPSTTASRNWEGVGETTQPLIMTNRITPLRVEK